jgi:enoyl-CoA hydratase/carnithine racemase
MRHQAHASKTKPQARRKSSATCSRQPAGACRRASTAARKLALRFIKEAVVAGMNLPLQQGLEFERKCFQLLFATADKTEGIRARLDKRTPRFTSG